MSIEITLPMPDDWHVHLRDGELFKTVAPFSGFQFYNNLLMPNLDPPLTTDEFILEYAERALGGERTLRQAGTHFVLYLTHRTTPTTIRLTFDAGVRMVKYYPHSGTTNSSSGLHTPHDLDDGVLEIMQELGMVLCVHGEVTPDVQIDPLKREYDFIPHLEWLVRSFPALKIVVEHVSSQSMLWKILDMPETVAATITAHHPFLTHWDAGRDPHCNCMPIAKHEEDRDRLAQVIRYAKNSKKIFFGSDSAPHAVSRKLGGAAGVWSSPVAIPVLWEHFTKEGELADAIENFVAFMCTNGADFYGVGPSLEQRPTMTLKHERWQVPEIWPIGDHRKVDGSDPDQVLVPWKAGEVLDWRVEGMEWFGEAYED